MESYASNETLPVKLTKVQSVLRGQVETKMQDGISIHSVNDHTANMIELQTNVEETESSSRHRQPGFIDHFDPLGKKQNSQIETTEQTPDRLYQKYSVKTGIGTAETLRYIGSNQVDNYEDVTKNQLIREDILVQRNCVKETSLGGAISFEVDTINYTDWDVVETVPDSNNLEPPAAVIE